MRSRDLHQQWATGSMSSRLVAALAGAIMEQLRRWRRSGVVSATALPPRRGAPCAYRWDEYRRARLAALLLAHGLQPQGLRAVLYGCCAVAAPDLDDAGFAEQLGRRLPDGVESIAVLKEFKSGWPLGQLHEYADIVDLRPDVLGGSPTLKGRRLETATLATLAQAGDTVAAIAEAYELSRSTVERALAFEQALDSAPQPPAPAASSKAATTQRSRWRLNAEVTDEADAHTASKCNADRSRSPTRCESRSSSTPTTSPVPL